MGHDTEMRRLRGFGDTNFVLLGQGEGADAPAAVPLPEVAYAFDAQGQTERRWRVRHFEATEGLSTLYECAVDLAAESLAENPDTLLGRYALLQWQRESVLRKLYGVVRRVEHRGAAGSRRLARAFMAPALWTLSQRSDARIFQGLTAVEVVQAVLQEAGLYAGMLDLQLQRQHPAREYCVQYRETDLAFVQRLLESEGITFFFRHEEEGETLVLADGAHAWGAVRTMDGGPIPIAGAELSTERVEAVRHLRWERELRPTGAVVRDFDFTRPDFRLERMAPRRRDDARSLYEPAPAVTLGQYAGAVYTRDDAQEQAQLRHDAEQVPGAVGEGEGVVVGMAPGALFALTLAGTHIPAQRYLVTRVEHTGDAPEELLAGASPRAAEEDRYRNRFACVPVEVAFRPARVTPRPTIAGMQTATVTGPAGEEVYTDEHGRVRVQFHWDRRGARDEHATCWLRTVQGPWAGNGWGFQFLPRVGMEVAVSFVEGDPDRPVVTGALYNGQHAPPFPLPEHRTRSGIVTQSVPGGGGRNEFGFEDRAGAEEVFLRAQRDLDERVNRDHATTVGADRHLRVGGDRTEDVAGVHTLAVGRDHQTTVGGSRREVVEHDRSDRIEGSLHERVARHRASEVGGTHLLSVEGDQQSVVRGGRVETVERGSLTIVRGDHDLQVSGRHAAAFHGGARTDVTGDFAVAASGRVRIEAPGGVVFACGDSSIELLGDEVKITAPKLTFKGADVATVRGGDATLRLDGDATLSAGTVRATSSGASLQLDADAALRGAHVRFGGTASRQSARDPASQGSPTAGREWVVRLFEPGTAPFAERRPLRNARFVARGHGPDAFEGSTDGDGVLRIPVVQERCVIDVQVGPHTFQFQGGALADHDDALGARHRLYNLGYGPPDVEAWPDATLRRVAERYQREHGIDVTGELDDATRASLREKHGG